MNAGFLNEARELEAKWAKSGLKPTNFFY